MRLSHLILMLSAAGIVGCQCKQGTTPKAEAQPAAQAVAAAPAGKAAVPSGAFVAYGEPVSADGASISVQQLLANVDQYTGKPVRVVGTVDKVCERKGCWLQMADGGKSLFVKFTCPIEGRLIPMDAVGKQAVAQGELAIKEVSEADARHIAEEAGKSPEEVAQIVGPQKQITLKSPGAIVYGLK